MQAFKFLPTTVGSGWVGAYVAVDHFCEPRDLIGKGEICLSYDCQNAEEFDAEIDKLIAQLIDLKAVGRKKFQDWKG